MKVAYALLLCVLLVFPQFSHARQWLTEQEVIDLVLKQNLEVLARDYDPQIAQTAITAAKAQFDALINGQVFYTLDQGDKQSVVFGTDNRTILWEAEAAKKFPYGIESRFSVSNQRDTTNSPFATESDLFETRLTWEARGHLLRNRLGKSDRGRVNFAKERKKAVRNDAMAAVEDQVQLAVTQYWNLVTAHDFLRVSWRFLKKARDFLNTTQEKQNLGLSEDPDVLAAQALVLERETEVLRAQDFIRDLEARLKNLLDFPLGEVLYPQEKLQDRESYLSFEESLKKALAQRSDYRSLIDLAKAQDIQIAIAKDQTWPSLDLFTSLQLNSVDSDYGKVLGDSFLAQNPNWTIGAQFNLYLENRLAKSELKKSQLEKAQLLIRLKALESQIRLEIDELIREIKLQKKEYKKFRRQRSVQKQKLNMELDNYQRGRSTSDIIVRFQTDFLDAEKKMLEAQLRLKRASVDLRYAMGILVPIPTKRLPHEVMVHP